MLKLCIQDQAPRVEWFWKFNLPGKIGEQGPMKILLLSFSDDVVI
jgi:hypothetical protein